MTRDQFTAYLRNWGGSSYQSLRTHLESGNEYFLAWLDGRVTYLVARHAEKRGDGAIYLSSWDPGANPDEPQSEVLETGIDAVLRWEELTGHSEIDIEMILDKP